MTDKAEKGKMSTDQTNQSPMMDILQNAFPGRSDEQIVPIGLIYAGVRWGKDYRFGEVPKDEQGNLLNVCSTEDSYWLYLSWLADYLNDLLAEPNDEQKGLCKYLDNMLPEDGVHLIGMNAALYQAETEPMESWIEEGSPFVEYAENMKKYVLDDDEEYDEETDHQLYISVSEELKAHHQYCPYVRHADVSYRIPLARAIKKVETKENRIKLIDSFYRIYDHYISK